MVTGRAAVRYAKAVLAMAQEKDMAAAVAQDMGTIADTVINNKELSMALSSPIIKANDKRDILRKVFSQAQPVTIGLFDLLVSNQRVDKLVNIAYSYKQQYDQSMGKQEAVVTTAVPLTPELEARMLAKVKEMTGKDAIIVNKVDESIIGGFILRAGDMQYDASISGKLNKLEQEYA